MTSPNVDADALDTLLRAERNNDERKVLWRTLAAYDLSNSYDEFVTMLGLRYGKGSEALYDTAHACYVAAWRRYGWDELQKMIRIGWNGLYKSNWRLM